MGIEIIPGIKANQDLFDVLDGLQSLWTSAGVTTLVKIGERFLNDEGRGNRVVFVPQPDVTPSESAAIRLEVQGRAQLQFGCDAYIWGADNSDEKVKHRNALGTLYNILATLPDVSGDRVFLTQSTRAIDPTQVDYGHQYKLSFYLLMQVDASTDMILPPKPYVSNPTTTVKDPS